MLSYWKKSILSTLIILSSIGTSTADNIEFLWDFDEAPIDGFRIYEGIVNSDYTIDYTLAVGEISPDLRQTSYTNPGKPGVIQKYCYKIRAYRDSTESEDSNIICLKINNKPLVPPQSVKFHQGENGIHYLKWDPVTRAKYYTVYYQSGDDYKEIVKTENTEVSIDTSELPAGTEELVVVAFKNDQVYSANSDPVRLERSGFIPAVKNFCFGSSVQGVVTDED